MRGDPAPSSLAPASSMLRWKGGWARLGPWRGNEHIAHVAVSADRPPSVPDVERGLSVLRSLGYHEAVTSALAPADTLPFVDCGFRVTERLHLMRHELKAVGRPANGTRRARRADHPAVLAVDHAAFDPAWRLDASGLDDALRATPLTRFRVSGAPDALTAYAITGRAGIHGYVQRVAVHPAARREGLGRSVVCDGLRWLRRHGARHAYVNTQLDNVVALTLYLSLGFRRLPVGLAVLHRDL